MGLKLGDREGSGSHLPAGVLVLAGVSTVVAVVVSAFSIYLHLKNYRKPALQRMVVRIMVMIPIYAVASLISLFSLEAAFFIDAIRDVYEAFVIYCFFVLLLVYLGGERSLLIMMHGRPPKAPPFPANIFTREIDVSDPYTFLFLKRGIMQYVYVKPILATATLILKACNKYNDGDLRANSGYLYVSVVYNVSICLALYCLAIFWLCVNDDLKPFRPVPKFLCVKGILFFSFWQSLAISILVAAGAIARLGPYTDAERISLGLSDTLICIEMPFFAIAHWYAFSFTDFVDETKAFVARMPFYYALRDAFGIKDVVEDFKTTMRGEGMDYREFEPSEGFIHQGLGRERRIRAGLRYSKGGKRKYWLPRPASARDDNPVTRGIHRALDNEDAHAPLLASEAADVVHAAPDMRRDADEDVWTSARVAEEGFELPFGDVDDADEQLYDHCRHYIFGDYNYPCVDVSSEAARRMMWHEEERVLRDERGAWYSPLTGARGVAALGQREGPVWQGYGAVGTTTPTQRRAQPDFDEQHDAKNPHRRYVDFEADKAETGDQGEVKLHWTRLQREGARPSSPSQTRGSPGVRSPPTLRTQSSTGSSGSGQRRSEETLRRSLDIQRRSSGTPRRSHDTPRDSPKQPTSSPLPPDAVDLVVETDEDRGGLQRVYRRGLDDGRGEVEVDDPGWASPSARIEVGEEVREAVEDREGVSRGGRDSPPTPGSPRLMSPPSVAVEPIARTTTPPRFVVDPFEDHEDNPWA